MVRIFCVTESASSRRKMVLPYDLDIFCPSRPGMREASVSSAGLDEDHLAGAFEVAVEPLAGRPCGKVLGLVWQERLAEGPGLLVAVPAGSGCATLS